MVVVVSAEVAESDEVVESVEGSAEVAVSAAVVEVDEVVESTGVAATTGVEVATATAEVAEVVSAVAKDVGAVPTNVAATTGVECVAVAEVDVATAVAEVDEVVESTGVATATAEVAVVAESAEVATATAEVAVAGAVATEAKDVGAVPTNVAATTGVEVATATAEVAVVAEVLINELFVAVPARPGMSPNVIVVTVNFCGVYQEGMIVPCGAGWSGTGAALPGSPEDAPVSETPPCEQAHSPIVSATTSKIAKKRMIIYLRFMTNPPTKKIIQLSIRLEARSEYCNDSVKKRFAYISAPVHSARSFSRETVFPTINLKRFPTNGFHMIVGLTACAGSFSRFLRLGGLFTPIHGHL